jgi:putative transposase
MDQSAQDNTVKFRGKYKTASGRLKGWDYGEAGFYFITICTKGRIHWFGKIKGGEMILRHAGVIVCEELEKTTVIRQNISMETWVVMPNHIHAIVAILDAEVEGVETPRRGVSTRAAWRPGTLGAIINQYKSTCTKRIRSSGDPQFAWQSRYYDHIIRNEQELEKISAYIQANPGAWMEDEYYKSECS